MKAGGRTDERDGYGRVIEEQEQEMLTLDGNHVFRAHFDGPSACLPSHSLALASRWPLPSQQTPSVTLTNAASLSLYSFLELSDTHTPVSTISCLTNSLS